MAEVIGTEGKQHYASMSSRRFSFLCCCGDGEVVDRNYGNGKKGGVR